MNAQSPEHDWFEKAEQDLEMARRAMSAGNPLPAMACYHCQQCVENYLKGFLVSRSIEFRPVHDLFYLIQQCAALQPAFAELAPIVVIIGRYGAGVRYPVQGFEEPDVEAANEAIKSAEIVSAFVTQNMQS